MSTSANSNNNNSSVGKSYVESAVETVQNAISGLTGNTSTAAGHSTSGQSSQADNSYNSNNNNNNNNNNTPQATVKGPGFTASSTGAIARDNPDRSAGSWNQTIGSAKEAVGGLVGSENLKTTGRQQHQQGTQQEAHGQLSDLVGGATERVKGAVGGTLASATGNQKATQEFQQQRDQGLAQQRGAEHDIAKQNEAAKQRQQ